MAEELPAEDDQVAAVVWGLLDHIRWAAAEVDSARDRGSEMFNPVS